MIRLIIVPAITLLLGVAAWGQSAEEGLEFDVASVKPSPPNTPGVIPGCTGGPGTPNPGIISCVKLRLDVLVTMAYKVSYDQMTVPEWTSGQEFDIIAHVPRGATKQQVPAMWARLLAVRFKIEVHREPKVVPNYELVVAKGGPKLEESIDDPTPAEAKAGEMKYDKEGFAELTTPGMVGLSGGRVSLYRPKMTMDLLARTLSSQLNHPVVDLTGLKGSYEIRLHWVRDTAPLETTGPRMSQAVQEQLGLRLEAKKGPVEFLVVDHIEKLPTEN